MKGGSYSAGLQKEDKFFLGITVLKSVTASKIMELILKKNPKLSLQGDRIVSSNNIKCDIKHYNSTMMSKSSSS